MTTTKRKKYKRFRSAETGEFVSKEEAEASPATTVSETVKIEPKQTGAEFEAQDEPLGAEEQQ